MTHEKLVRLCDQIIQELGSMDQVRSFSIACRTFESAGPQGDATRSLRKLYKVIGAFYEAHAGRNLNEE